MKEKIIRYVDILIRFFLYLLIAVLPFSKAGVEICVSVSIGLWIVKRLLILNADSGRGPFLPGIIKIFKPKESILNGPIAFFIIAGAFSMVWSVDFGNSLLAFFAKFMEGIALYFIIIEAINRKRHIHIIVGLLLCSAVVVCADGIIQRFFTGYDIFRQMPMTRGGITAAFNHKNDLGAFLLFPLLIGINLLLHPGRFLYPKTKVFICRLAYSGLVILFCLYSVAMSLTNSRGAWAALALAVMFSCRFINRKHLIGIVVCGAVLFTVFTIFSPRITPEDIKTGTFDIPLGMMSRVEIWEDALNIIKVRPIFGNGINTYMKAIAQMHITREPTYAHNCYLQMAAEIGIIGLVCFLWILFRLFSRSIHEVRGRCKQGVSFLLIGLISALFGFLIHSFVDTDLYSLQLNALFWYIVGLAVCVYERLRAG